MTGAPKVQKWIMSNCNAVVGNYINKTGFTSPVINVKANFCAYNMRIKFRYLLFYSGGFYKKRETEASFVYIIFAVLTVKIIIIGF